MSLSRLFAVVAVIGLIAATAFTIRRAGTTSAAAESVGSTGRGNIAEGIIELHKHQELAADSTAASAASRGGNIVERIIALHRRQELAVDSTAASAGTVHENISERNFESQDQLAKLRAATAQFHQTDAAYAAGYKLVPGLDYCFDNPGVGGMGVHYIKTSSLDLNLDPLQPEAMVYAVGENRQLQLGAVEYIVPAAAWDAAGNTQPPSVLGQSLHLDKGLGVYVLHAWIWQENPSGMFNDWNPKVSCP